ncbi:cell wall-binding repeat-containing protein [Miniphocaeibacter halophilus]|uniref:Cell wall-binding repeat-containing protein n=1 Tax=Miniphocaeibacter halophilus TaxID=2931922 RepID=A0AC61N744_9FIRM|nr:cell wall-binding repeat-containing protein [Miniphocaeibacter halophilus]QQK08198.1 cell wall-binding repeat-containing protein [Miniphocaeibacter halophilus]
MKIKKYFLSFSIILINLIFISASISKASGLTDVIYTKIDDDVYGRYTESTTIEQTNYRGRLKLNPSQQESLNKSGYKSQERKGRVFTTELGQAFINRFYKNGNFVDCAYFKIYGNTGGPLINFNYLKIKEMEVSLDLYYDLIEDKTAIGLYDRIDKNSFKNDGRTLEKINYFDIITDETSERVYLFKVKDIYGNISKYILKTIGKLELNNEKSPGSKVTITYNTRIKGIDVPSQTLDYGDLATPPEEPIYEKIEISSGPSAGVYNKKFGGWFYDNRSHSIPMDFSQPVKKDTNLFISWCDTFRLRGKDRFETSRLVASKFLQSDYAVIVNGYSYPDALSASPLATATDSPLILTRKDNISNEDISLLKSLAVKKAYIIGAENTISNNIEEQVSNIGIITTRITGSDRIETSLNIAEEIYNITGDKKAITFANGFDFPDALSSTTVANRFNTPIILASPEKIEKSAVEFVNANNISDIYIVGGENSISNDIEKNFNNKKITRISGSNRYKTSLEVTKLINYNHHAVILVSGKNYADGIVAGPYAGLTQFPILLMPQNDNLDLETKEYLKSIGLHEAVTIGSEKWISDKLQEKVSCVTIEEES